MTKRTVKITGDVARQRAKQLIDAAPLGYAATVGEESRTQEQNRLMWPLIADLQAQVAEFTPFAAEDMKLRFLNALGTELRFLPELEGAGHFPVGQRSSTLSKSQFSALIELMFMTGAKHGVVWSKKALEVREKAA